MTSIDIRQSSKVQTDQGGKVISKSNVKQALSTLAYAVVVGVVGFAALSGGFAWGESHANDHWKPKYEEFERRTAERELQEYAKLQGLGITEIRVNRNQQGVLEATWVQGNQACTSRVFNPTDEYGLWTAASVEEGTGACLTASGSAGIGASNNQGDE